MTFALYTDAGLTSLLASNPVFDESVDHSILADDVVIYLGSPDTTPDTKIQAASDPGVDPILVSITDADPAGDNDETSITLSDSSDFTGKVAGDPLNLGVEILDGVASAKPIYIRFRDATGAQHTDTDIGISITPVNEYEI